MGVTHTFVSAKAEGADNTVIRPSDWNAEHPVSDLTDAEIAAANKDGAIATPSMRTLGAGALQAAPGSERMDVSYWRRIYGSGADALHECWYPCALLTGMYLTTGTPTINVLRAMPFIVPQTITIDSLAMCVTSGGTNSHARIGIYADGGNLHPGDLVLDSGALDTTTQGVKSVTGLTQVLTPGLYWGAHLSDGSPVATIRTYTYHYGIIPLLGLDNTLGGTATNCYQQIGKGGNQVYGALPDPFLDTAHTAVLTSYGSLPFPGVFFRRVA